MRLRGLLGLPAFALYKVTRWLWAVLVLLAQAFVVVVGMVYMLAWLGLGCLWNWFYNEWEEMKVQGHL